jgi:hypothetical protein
MRGATGDARPSFWRSVRPAEFLAGIGSARFESPGSTTSRIGPRPIFGIDALQTIALAMQYALVTLAAVRPPLSWLGTIGDVGVSKTIPGHLPTTVQNRIEALVQRECQRLARKCGTPRPKAGFKRAKTPGATSGQRPANRTFLSRDTTNRLRHRR